MKKIFVNFLLFCLGIIQRRKPVVTTWEEYTEILEERELRIRALAAQERLERRRHGKWKSLHSRS
jgi:hypothetical protein